MCYGFYVQICNFTEILGRTSASSASCMRPQSVPYQFIFNVHVRLPRKTLKLEYVRCGVTRPRAVNYHKNRTLRNYGVHCLLLKAKQEYRPPSESPLDIEWPLHVLRFDWDQF